MGLAPRGGRLLGSEEPAEMIMIVCVDVDYRENLAGQPTGAVAAAVLFPSWSAAYADAEYTCPIEEVAAYVPGQFYRRELPCLLALLAKLDERSDLDERSEPLGPIIIDGYVYLDDHGKPGLGSYLYDALEHRVPVIGVAKSPFRANKAAREVLRGTSQQPLYVTAVGVDPDHAARNVQGMHGRFRFPTMLKRVDRLCRDTPA